MVEAHRAGIMAVYLVDIELVRRVSAVVLKWINHKSAGYVMKIIGISLIYETVEQM